MSLLLAVFIGLSVVLAWRLRTTKRVVKELIRSAQDSEPMLLAIDNHTMRSMQLDQLVKSFNELIAEKATISGAGQEYHGQIQALLGNLREAVAMVDQENAIVSANPALRELTGTRQDPVGMRLDALIHGTQFLQFIREVHQKGRGQLTEMEVRINKVPHWLEVSAAPLTEKSKMGGHYTLFIFHDITRQKRLEKMRTEFVANVSHELRTPVTIIKGFAETLIEDDDVLTKQEKKRFLEKISNNSERLHSLLQDLLLLSRLESTEMVLQRESFSLNGFINDYIENWKASQKKDSLPVSVQLSDDRMIYADPLRLSQVLTNLIGNAQDHGVDATGILLSTHATEQGLMIAVSDDGQGIPENDLPLIFQRFYRVDKGRSRESGGTGLGLSIVKHIVAQHGWAIHAISEKGEGTRIEILIPAAQSGSDRLHRER